MKIETLMLYKYDFINKKDFFYESENELNIPINCIPKEYLLKFYQRKFSNDFISVLNNIVTIDCYNKINFYISSLKKTIDSIRNKIIGFKLYLDKINSYIIYHISDYDYPSYGDYIVDDYWRNEKNDFKITLGFDIHETFYLRDSFIEIINCFSSELEDFFNKIDEQLLSVEHTLYNAPSAKLIIPNNIFRVFFTFLTENKLLKLETGENVNKTLAAYILPKYFLIEKEPNEEYANETIRKQLSLDFEKIKEDHLIQKLYNFLRNGAVNE